MKLSTRQKTGIAAVAGLAGIIAAGVGFRAYQKHRDVLLETPALKVSAGEEIDYRKTHWDNCYFNGFGDLFRKCDSLNYVRFEKEYTGRDGNQLKLIKILDSYDSTKRISLEQLRGMCSQIDGYCMPSGFML